MAEDCYNGCTPLCAHRTDGLCYWGGVAQAAQALVDAVETYTAPKKGQFLHRSDLLRIKDALKELLK